ncbi:hypothetical protein [Klebsiella variicola]|uniref:hypothetical protein n=1 Tax=Klebsiella variicola TaxID=244366 RepID=UPI0035B67865
MTVLEYKINKFRGLKLFGKLIDVVFFFFTDFLILQHVIVAQFIVWHQKSTRSASLDNVALARSN